MSLRQQALDRWANAAHAAIKQGRVLTPEEIVDAILEIKERPVKRTPVPTKEQVQHAVDHFAKVIVPPSNRVQEYRPEGTRNFIRVGDTVKVTPSKPGKRDGFLATVKEIEVYPGVEDVKCVHVSSQVNGAARTLYPDRIKRVSQAKNPQRKKDVK